MKKFSMILTALLLAMVLAGCGCSHEWKEAACEAPQTCTKCGETEGDAQGHAWVEATCAEAKHCTTCGKTEGEPLEHTLTEANYQEAAKCTVCGAEVGEPLEAYFEKYGLKCNVETGQPYDYVNTTPKNPDKTITGQLTVIEEEDIPTPNTYEAIEGYEWRRIWIDLLVPKSELEDGATIQLSEHNYYEQGDGKYRNSESGEVDTFSVNWNGKEYTECAKVFTVIQNTTLSSQSKTSPNAWTFIVEFAVQVPVGYDGIVIGAYNDTPEKKALKESGNPVYAHDLFDEDSLIYRFQ